MEKLFTNRLDSRRAPALWAGLAGLRVSAHFFVRRDGRLLQFVPCAKRAWHAGASSWNGRERCNDFSVGIELEGTDDVPYAAAQYATLARLGDGTAPPLRIADVVGHSDIAPGRKTDPGPAFDWRGCAVSSRIPAPMTIPLEVTEAGLYCAAGDFHVDPWQPVSRALITHAHADHARAGSAALSGGRRRAPVAARAARRARRPSR